jgi:uncharacterized protein YlxP (DUF503 family)
MVVGLLTVELHFPENSSLKGKRMLLRRLTERLKQRFNVSVAEVEHQDLWQRSTLALACVNTSGREADSTLAHALDLIAAYSEAELISHNLEIR